MDHYVPFTHTNLSEPNCPACDAGIPIKVVQTVPFIKSYQFRFPRSTKKRIQKKWRKNPKNWHYSMEIKLMEWSPVTYEKIREFMEKVKNAPVVSIDTESIGSDGEPMMVLGA